MNKSLLIVGCVGALVVGGIAVKELLFSPQGGPGGMGGPQAVAVEAEEVLQVTWQETSEAVGTTYANESVEITAQVSDVVESIHFEDGQQVEAGDVLVVLDHAEEDAELQVAKANLSEQERELKRLQGLRSTNSVSENLLDERMTQRETARFRLAGVEARLRDKYIRAPFSGVLGLREVSIGSYVSPGRIITTLDDVETIKLDFNVPAVHLENLKQGMEVFATTPALTGRRFAGNIVSINSRVNAIDRSLTLRAELPNEDLAIKPGMLMHVVIVLADRPALTVSETAIVQEKENHYVYVIDDLNQPVAARRQVQIGTRKPGVVEIVSGLEAGDMIISRGTNTVREGAPVNIVNLDILTAN